MYNREALSEFDSVLAGALNEAQEARHLHAGGDHLFLTMLGERYATTSGILMRYEHLEEDARAIVRELHPKWYLPKRGKVRLATASRGLMAARARAIETAQQLGGIDAKPTGLDLLEAMFTVQEPYFVELLRRLDVNSATLLREINETRELSAKN